MKFLTKYSIYIRIVFVLSSYTTDISKIKVAKWKEQYTFKYLLQTHAF